MRKTAFLFYLTLINFQNIISDGEVSIARDAENNRSESVINRSGNIESQENTTIFTDTLKNERISVNASGSTTQDLRGSIPSRGNSTFVIDYLSPYAPEYEFYQLEFGGGGSGGERGRRTRTVLRVTGGDKLTFKAYQTISTLDYQGAASRIVAGGNIDIDSKTVVNEASLIHGTNSTINTNNLSNRGFSSVNEAIYFDYELTDDFGIDEPSFEYTRVKTRTVQSGGGETLHSTISATNNVTINAAQRFDNSVIGKTSNKVAPNQSAVVAKDVLIHDKDGAVTVSLPVQNNIAFPEFTLPSNPNGLFLYSPDPESGYVIETNPLLTQMGKYLGSDYFRQTVGITPNDKVTFLGDAFYDTRIVTQSIFEQTGRRYLDSQIGSDFSQMQALLDAAGYEQRALELEVGVALTASQIDRLTQDIVWYETIMVGGQEVLAPKLYLAKIKKNNYFPLVGVEAGNLSVNAGQFNNEQGTLSAHNDLTIVSNQDLVNSSGLIEGDNVSLVSANGNVINQTLTTQTNIDKYGNLVDSNANNIISTVTDVAPKAAIRANRDLSVTANDSIQSLAGEMSAQNDLTLAASNNIEIGSITETDYQLTNKKRSREETNRSLNVGSEVFAGGNVVIDAGNKVDILASSIVANQKLALSADNDISIKAAENKQSDTYDSSRFKEINRSITHQGSSLIGNTVSIESNNDLVVSGSHISATESVDLMAKGDVNILAVNDSDYHYDKTTKKKSFGRKKTTINESYQETVKGSSIQAGENINITAQQNEFVSTVGGDSEIRLIGSNLDAGGNVDMAADGDITLAAQSYKEFERHETIKKGFGGLSGRNKGSIDDATLLNSSYLINAGDTNLTSGSSIGVVASEVVTDGNVNLQALDDVLIAAGDVLRQSQQWDEKTSFLSGGHLFELEKKRQGEESSTAQASAIQSGRNLTVNSGSVKVIGSELNAGQNADIIADTGSVEILAAKETKKTFESEEKLAISIGEGSLKGISFDDGQLKISLGEASYDKVEQQSEALEHRSSIVTANTDLSIQSESDILVEGSVLTADGNNSQSGDLRLAAKDNVIIKEAENTFQQQRDEIHGKAEVSFVIQHQAIEVAKAAESLKESTENLKQAKKEYQQYKDNLETLTQTLKALEQDYKVKKPGVLYEDVEELRDILSEVKSDEEWYIAGITLATVDVASKTTLLVQQTNAAANSIGTNGFDAGLHLDIEASKTGTSTEQTSSLASNLSGQNIAITAGSKDTNQATVQGSIVQAQDRLSLEANEINILASVDTQKSKAKTESGNISASMTVHGSSLGMNVNAGLNTNNSKSSSITHNNSQLTADTISLTSQSDTNIKGANVDADSELVANIGGDLNIASVQNRQSSSNQGAGFSAGMSFDSSGTASGMNGGLNASSGRIRTKDTLQTTLTSGGTADVIVANNTDLKGALVATVDDQGRDLGNLNLTTDTLTFVDLTNSHYEQNKDTGINSSVGVKNGGIDSTYNSTNLQHTNTSGYSKSKALATVGEGVLTLADSENSDDTSTLNRDTQHTEKDLFTVDRKQGDFDVTLDHRLLTEDGRNAIKEDGKRTELAGKSLADVALEDSVKLADAFEHMDVVQKELDVQLLIAQKKGDAAVNINNLENSTDKQKQDAIYDYAEAYSEVFGISIESALVIAVNKSIGGAHYTGDKGSNIVLNDKAMKNAQDYMNTLAHEVTHGLEKQGIIGDKGDQGENYAELVGSYAEGNYEFALENSGLGKVNKGNTNAHIGNDSALVRNNWETVKNVPVGQLDFETVRDGGYGRFAQLMATDPNTKKLSLDEMNNLLDDVTHIMTYGPLANSGASSTSKMRYVTEQLNKQGVSPEITKFLENNEAKINDFMIGPDDEQREAFKRATLNITSLGVSDMVLEPSTSERVNAIKDNWDTAFTAAGAPSAVAGVAGVAQLGPDIAQVLITKGVVLKSKDELVAALKSWKVDVTEATKAGLDDLYTGYKRAVDTLKRVEVKAEQGTFGSNGANITVKLKPKANDAAEVVSDSTALKPNENEGFYISDDAMKALQDRYGAENVARVYVDNDTGRTVIETTPGQKGGWNKFLNNPEPNTNYKTSDSLYKTDELGRVDTVSTDLTELVRRDRNNYQQGQAGKTGGIKDGLEDDHGGHLIASMFDGLGEQINYVPMNKKVNGSGGEWGSLERIWRSELDRGSVVKVDIKPVYTGSSKRPDEIVVTYKINNGIEKERVIKNVRM